MRELSGRQPGGKPLLRALRGNAAGALRGVRGSPPAGVPFLRRLRRPRGRGGTRPRARCQRPRELHAQAPRRQDPEVALGAGGRAPPGHGALRRRGGLHPLAEKLDPEEVHRDHRTAASSSSRPRCTASRARSTSTRATASWRCSGRPSPTRTAHAAPCTPPSGIQRALRSIAASLEAAAGARAGQMRIGLNTGPVVVGTHRRRPAHGLHRGGRHHQPRGAHAAERRPGTVVVSEATHQAIEGFFETRDLGLIDVKGHEAGARVRGPAARGGASRIEVGQRARADPARRARARARAPASTASARRPAAAARWCSWPARRGSASRGSCWNSGVPWPSWPGTVTWLEGQCVSFGQSIPFLPLVDQLRENFGDRGVRRRARDHCQGRARHAAHGRARGAHPVHPLPPVGGPGRPGRLHRWTRATRRRRIFEAVRALTAARGAAAPAGAGLRGPALDRHEQRGVPRLAAWTAMAAVPLCSS